MNTKVYVILFSLFLAACGGGGSDSGVTAEVSEVAEVAEEAEVVEAPSYDTHSTNVSGVWSGTTTMFGAAVVVNVTVHQAVSDSAENPAQALTGTVTLNGGAPFNLTGTKEGDAWSVSGASAAAILSTDQTLSSAGDSSGTLSLTIGAPDNTGTVDLSLTKV